MRVLVIGRGQVGSTLLLERWPASVRVASVARPEVDLLDTTTIEGALRDHTPDLVINAAAYTAVDRAESEPDVAFAVNAEGVGRLAEACAGRGAALLDLSSDYVFDGSKRAPYAEGDPVNPLGAYGRSKAAGEALVRKALSRHLLVRSAWVYSPRGHNFVRTMLRLARERDELRVVDDQVGSPTSAGDLARAIVAVVRRWVGGEEPRWGTYHYAGAGEASWFDLASRVLELQAAHTGRRPPIRRITTAELGAKAPRPSYSVLDTAKIQTEFGVVVVPWQDAVATVVTEILAQGGSPK